MLVKGESRTLEKGVENAVKEGVLPLKTVAVLLHIDRSPWLFSSIHLLK